MDCNPPGSSVHAVLPARILEPFPSAGELPDLRIELKSLALQADSLPLLSLEKPSIGGEESKTNESDWQRKGHGKILFSFLNWVLWRNLGDLILVRIFTLCWLLPITSGSHQQVLSGVYFFIFFRLCPMALMILVPWPRIESVPPALEAQHLNHWTTREVPEWGLKCSVWPWFY